MRAWTNDRLWGLGSLYEVKLAKTGDPVKRDAAKRGDLVTRDAAKTGDLVTRDVGYLEENSMSRPTKCLRIFSTEE